MPQTLSKYENSFVQMNREKFLPSQNNIPNFLEIRWKTERSIFQQKKLFKNDLASYLSWVMFYIELQLFNRKSRPKI